MTPDAAVACLAEIVVSRAEFSEHEIYQAMGTAGVPEPIADRAYKFTQIAWGRVFLDGMGVRSPPDFLCFNAEGDVAESGQLAEEPYFVAAMQLAKQHSQSPGFIRLALMSADVNAVNSLLNQGSKPENLATSRAAFFLEPPTAVGMEKASRTLSQQFASTKTPAKRNKPWWRFWG